MANGKSDIIEALENLPCVKRVWVEWVSGGNGILEHFVIEIAVTDPNAPGFRTQDISTIDTEVAHQLVDHPVMSFGGYRIVPEGFY